MQRASLGVPMIRLSPVHDSRFVVPLYSSQSVHPSAGFLLCLFISRCTPPGFLLGLSISSCRTTGLAAVIEELDTMHRFLLAQESCGICREDALEMHFGELSVKIENLRELVTLSRSTC